MITAQQVRALVEPAAGDEPVDRLLEMLDRRSADLTPRIIPLRAGEAHDLYTLRLSDPDTPLRASRQLLAALGNAADADIAVAIFIDPSMSVVTYLVFFTLAPAALLGAVVADPASARPTQKRVLRLSRWHRST